MHIMLNTKQIQLNLKLIDIDDGIGIKNIV